MIHHLFYRTFNDPRPPAKCHDREMSSTAALEYIIEAELNFGSSIADLTDTRLVTTSSCMGTVDEMTFTGPPEDMVFIRRLCRNYNLLKVHHEVSTEILTRNYGFNKEAMAFIVSMSEGNKKLAPALAASIWSFVPSLKIEGMSVKDLVATYLMMAESPERMDEVRETFS